MPSGLPDVTQRFDADTSGYIRGIREMIAANRELVASIGDAQRKLNDARGDAGGGNWGMFGPGGVAQIREFNKAMDEYADAMKEAAAQNREFNALQAQTEKLSDEGRSALNSLSEEYRQHGETVAQAKQAQSLFKDGLIDQANSTQDAIVAMGEHEQALARLAKTYGTAQEAFAKSDFSTPFQYTTAHIEKLNDALAVTEKRANSFATAFYGAGGASRAGDALRGIGAGAFGPFDPNFISGGGGGGGGFAAAAGGFFGAMRPSNVFGNALPTLQVAHLITMFTMEALSTIVPAAVAAGAAGVVGLQAGQNLYLRGNAMYSAQEALGGAYGNQTFGTMLGLSRNLQNAQDLAQGGVFGIAGGLKDLVGQGSGAFTGMGVQTIAMIDRGIAGMVLNKRMKQLTSAVAGGTGFLRSFGDIGANLGDTLLNLAPNLPGMGPMFLGGLKGITGAMAGITGALPGTLMGGALAGEAGWRWGKLALGGGKLPWFLGGGKVGGMAGLAERLGLGTVADAGAGVEGAGLAGFLDVAGGPVTAAAALSAFALSQLAGTMPTAQGRQIAGFQTGINQSFGAGALPLITNALYKTAKMAQQGAAPGGLAASEAQNIPMMETTSQIARFGPQAGMGQTLTGAVQSFASQLGDLVAAGPSAVKALQGIGIKGVPLTQAFEAMSMAMISPQDMKGGQLDARAKQQLQQFYQTYRTATIGGQPGTASGLLMAGAADYIMSSTQMKSLSQVNQGLDAMTQIMTGGASGQATLFGMLGGTPVKTRRGGLQLAAPPAMNAMAKALSNVFSPQGAAAWTTFAGPQGMIAAQQANMDQIRTYLTLGAITGQQGAQLGGFDLQQMLPLASHSKMAQYMLEQQAMQANIPGISVGMSYKNLVKAITGTATTSRGAMGILTQGTKATADLPALAASLITGDMGGPSAIQSALTAQMAQQALKVAGPGGITGTNVNALRASMAAGGVKPGQMQIGVDAILKNLHVPAGVISQVNSMLSHEQATIKVKADAAQAKAAIAAATKDHQLTFKANADVAQAKSQLASVEAARHTVTFNSRLIPPHVPTLYGTVIYNAVIAGGGTRGQAAVAAGNIGKTSGYQTGGMVPGSGSGDIIPALLEPGEAIIPRYLVPLIAPILAAHRVPGFGGVPQSSASHFADGGLVPHVLGFPDPTTLQGKAGQFAFTLIDGITRALSSSGAKKIADALVTQIGKEIQYAKNVASAAMSGQGYGNSGLFGMFTPPPKGATGSGPINPSHPAAWNAYVANFAADTPQPQSVQQQMQSYLHSVQSFTKDIAKLRHEHLNKAVIAQLIGAGPVQGDLFAQSILTGQGGVGAVNKLWGQLGHATKGLGNQAELAQYGGLKASNTNVSITINAGSGGAAGLNLTAAQIKQITEQVQAALLKQARRNNKTGLQLAGKGA